MSNRIEKVPWQYITIVGLVWKGLGPGDCGGFLQLRRGDGAVMGGTNILSDTEDGHLLITSDSGHNLRYFCVAGSFRLDPVVE